MVATLKAHTEHIIATYLRGLLAVGEDVGQNLLLQKIEAGVDIDTTIVSDRIVTARNEIFESWIGQVRAQMAT